MKRQLWRIILAAVIYIAGFLTKTDIWWIQPTIFLVSFIIVGGDVVLSAIKNITKGKVFDENFLMSIAAIGAFLIDEIPEGVAVMLFYQVGELFQSYAVDKSRKSIATLMDIRPDYANVKQGEELIRMDPWDVKIGDTLVIKAGEKIPLDATVLEGYSMIDTSAMTGESLPREAEPKDEILSGCINISGLLTARVNKEFGESTVSKVLDLVENASSKKSKSEQFITRFARYYTPIVVIVAALLALLPPLLIRNATFDEWIYRSLSFLVVSCPCALVISIPLSFFGGLGGASRKGILIKGSNYLEALAKAEIIAFDKTGTLTKGVFNVQELHPVEISEEDLLEITAYAESYSNHPISLSLKRAYGKDIDHVRIKEVSELAGHGVSAIVDGRSILAGNAKLMKREQIEYKEGSHEGTAVHVAIDNRYAGYIVIADELREDSLQAIKELKAASIRLTVMLTGDLKHVASKVASKLGIDRVYSELLPQEKVEKLEALYLEKTEKGKLAFVGDGINDAPVLARADIGIAMGGLGSDAAIEAADVVIMTDEPSKIATAIKISQNTLRIARQNASFAIGVKILVLILSTLGLATMWAAVFADVGVTVLAILNSFRAMNVKRLS